VAGAGPGAAAVGGDAIGVVADPGVEAAEGVCPCDRRVPASTRQNSRAAQVAIPGRIPRIIVSAKV